MSKISRLTFVNESARIVSLDTIIEQLEIDAISLLEEAGTPDISQLTAWYDKAKNLLKGLSLNMITQARINPNRMPNPDTLNQFQKIRDNCHSILRAAMNIVSPEAGDLVETSRADEQEIQKFIPSLQTDPNPAGLFKSWTGPVGQLVPQQAPEAPAPPMVENTVMGGTDSSSVNTGTPAVRSVGTVKRKLKEDETAPKKKISVDGYLNVKTPSDKEVEKEYDELVDTGKYPDYFDYFRFKKAGSAVIRRYH
jgi:hypothetical protein